MCKLICCIRADSVGWTGWEVLIVHDEWKMALVIVLVEVERVKMAEVSQSAGTVVHCELLQRDWIIQKCCVEFPPVVKLQGGLKIICLEVAGCWLSTTTLEVGCADADEGLDGCCTLVNHCSRLCCGYLCRLHNWNGDWLSIRYGRYSHLAVALVASGS